MKKIVLSLSIFFSALTLLAQDATKKGEDLVKFKETAYNFGKIKQGVPVNHDFVFSNISGSAVVIENASASCGCTTPTWPKSPILKDKSDKVNAGFNAAAVGQFNKTVYVKVAGTAAPMELKISGEVLSTEEYDKYQKSLSEKK